MALYAPRKIMVTSPRTRRVKENMKIWTDFHIKRPPVLVEWKCGKIFV
jgi:hypothetical protein